MSVFSHPNAQPDAQLDPYTVAFRQLHCGANQSEPVAPIVPSITPVNLLTLQTLILRYKEHLHPYDNLLRVIVKHGHPDDLKTAIAHGYPLSFEALHDAAEQDDATMAEILLDAGVPVDIIMDHRSTPLSCAASNGSNLVIELLLRRGSVTLNDRDYLGITPLFRAVMFHHVTTVELLMKAGSTSLNDQDKHGRTCFHFVSCIEIDNPDDVPDSSSNIEMLELLVKLGCTSFTKSCASDGTPFHAALRYEIEENHPDLGRQCLEVLTVLIRIAAHFGVAGQMLDAVTTSGESPMDRAIYNLLATLSRDDEDPTPRKGECDIIHLLLACGAMKNTFIDFATGEISPKLDQVMANNGFSEEMEVPAEDIAMVREKVVTVLRTPLDPERTQAIRDTLFFTHSLTEMLTHASE